MFLCKIPLIAHSQFTKPQFLTSKNLLERQQGHLKLGISFLIEKTPYPLFITTSYLVAKHLEF